MKRLLALLLSAALMLSLTACGKYEKSESSGSKDKSYSGSSKNSDSVSTDSSDDTSKPNAEPEPLKTLEMFEFLPEIPVTDVSAFKYRYDEEKGGIIITDFLTDETKIRIPDTIEGKPVVGLSLNEEFGDEYFKELPIDSSYDDYPDYRKYDITELILPDTVTEIRSPSVNNYHGFTYDSPVLDKVEYINIPSGFSHTGAAFRGLKSVYFGNDTEYLYPDIFIFSKDSIEKVYIPSSVSAFSKYYLMSYEWVAGEVTYSPYPKLKEIYYCGNTYNGYTDELHHLINDVNGSGLFVKKYDEYWGNKNVVLLSGIASEREDVVVPDGVTDISYSAFRNNSTIRNITFPASVKRFLGGEGEGCFDNCENLISIKFDKDCKLEMLLGFNNCPKLERVVLPESVAEIGSYGAPAFRNCTKLKSIVIPNGVAAINADSFSGCTSLKSVKLPDSVTELGNSVFNDCTSLEELELPNSISSLGSFFGTYPFSGCTALKKIILGDDMDVFMDLEQAFSSFKDNPGLKIKYKGKEYSSFGDVKKAMGTYGFEVSKNTLAGQSGYTLNKYSGQHNPARQREGDRRQSEHQGDGNGYYHGCKECVLRM